MSYIKHDMDYGGFKDLSKRTAADKVLGDKAFNIAKNARYYGYQRSLTSVIYKFLDKKTANDAINNAIIQDKELAEKLGKAVIRKFEKQKV